MRSTPSRPPCAWQHLITGVPQRGGGGLGRPGRAWARRNYHHYTERDLQSEESPGAVPSEQARKTTSIEGRKRAKDVEHAYVRSGQGSCPFFRSLRPGSLVGCPLFVVCLTILSTVFLGKRHWERGVTEQPQLRCSIYGVVASLRAVAASVADAETGNQL